ncbi:MAG: sortase [Candidatus Shapirobacteria bacterium]|nr:sortase [Candidatus Shapirobacteria bacterium]
MFDFIRAIPKKRSVKIGDKSGVIFYNLSGNKKLFFNLGTSIVLTSIFLLIYLYQPLFNSWLNYKQINKNTEIKDNTFSKTYPTPKSSPTITTEEPAKLQENNEFKIEIPKIGAITEIIAEVSPVDKNQYLQVLKNNKVAHSNYSALPGSGKGSMTYLFAHSTEQSIQTMRKNSVFYLLGELDKDDKILISYQGEVIEYTVYMKKIVTAKEFEYLTYSDSTKEVLILQTCWPIGTNWKRLLVFAQRI